jgi:hypothetical protein
LALSLSQCFNRYEQRRRWLHRACRVTRKLTAPRSYRSWTNTSPPPPSQKKPFSAVTVTIENLTAEAYEEDDFSGIPDLVEVIGLQATGPSEAARALRKKLKYGNVHRQLRALVILDGLVQNAGDRFQRNFLDEPLLERLRVCGTSDLSDPAVKAKCRELFRGWAAFGKTPGLEKLARLHKVSRVDLLIQSQVFYPF